MEESFSFNVREEISRWLPDRPCCQEALLASIIYTKGKIDENNPQRYIEVKVGISRVARLIYALLKKISADGVYWEKEQEKFLEKRNIFNLYTSKTSPMEEFVKKWGLTGTLQKKNIRKACCKRAFLTGSFLASGSVNSPYTYYHFEIVQRTEEGAKILKKILQKMEVEAKITPRRGKYVVYLKKADSIANLLNILGAHNSLLKFEEVRAIKETKREVYRKVNAEISNLDKRIKAAIRQIQNINYIKDKGYWKDIPPRLQRVAFLRIQYPQASLKELGEKFSPPVSKSSVNSMFRQIEKIVHEIKESQRTNN